MIELVLPLLEGFEAGRLVESLLFLIVLLWRLRPHMKMIEKRMQGIEKNIKHLKGSMDHSFEKGEARFETIEFLIESLDDRLTTIETVEIKGE